MQKQANEPLAIIWNIDQWSNEETETRKKEEERQRSVVIEERRWVGEPHPMRKLEERVKEERTKSEAREEERDWSGKSLSQQVIYIFPPTMSQYPRFNLSMSRWRAVKHCMGGKETSFSREGT